MPDGATLPVLDHELADDELQWMKSVYADFSKARAAAGPEFDPKEALRAILARVSGGAVRQEAPILPEFIRGGSIAPPPRS